MNQPQLNDGEVESVQHIVERLLGQMAQVREKRKANKEMIEDFLNGDMQFREAQTGFDQAKLARDVEKNRLMATPQGASLDVTRKEINEEYKELSESLSSHLQALVTSGVGAVDIDGKELQIKVKCQINTGQLSLFER